MRICRTSAICVVGVLECVADDKRVKWYACCMPQKVAGNPNLSDADEREKFEMRDITATHMQHEFTEPPSLWHHRMNVICLRVAYSKVRMYCCY